MSGGIVGVGSEGIEISPLWVTLQGEYFLDEEFKHMQGSLENGIRAFPCTESDGLVRHDHIMLGKLVTQPSGLLVSTLRPRHQRHPRSHKLSYPCGSLLPCLLAEPRTRFIMKHAAPASFPHLHPNDDRAGSRHTKLDNVQNIIEISGDYLYSWTRG